MKKLVLTILCCSAMFLQCKESGPNAEAIKADEDLLLKTDSAWSDSTSDFDTFMTYILDDAHVLAPNEAIAYGKDEIKNTFSPMFDLPGFSVKWEPSMVEIASSGDMGYTIGAYKLSVNDSTGMPMVDTGKYMTVWKKQEDGNWKVIADMFNTDLPMH